MPNFTAFYEPNRFDAKRVVRNDGPVAEVNIKEGSVGTIETIYSSPRVLSQTPKAGTQLARGATVNLVLANGRTIPSGAVTGGYNKWQADNLGKVYDDYVKDDEVMSNLVAKYAENMTLSDAERTQALQKLGSKNVTIGATPGDDLDSVMVALGAAKAFNGLAG